VLATDPQCAAVQAELDRLARENSADGILIRQRAASALIGRHSRQRQERLQAELQQAESDLRDRMPQIAEQLLQVARAASGCS
jgi:hypothetical protein